MSETDRIGNQIRRMLEGGAWHGPALLEILDGVEATTASAKPVPTAHSIWEIVLHLRATQELVLGRVAGVARTLSPEEDWAPVVDGSEESWRDAVRTLRQNDEKLRKELGAFPDERLDQPLVEGGSSAYDNLHGYIQHSLYHAGQMALVRKAVENQKSQ